MFAGHSGAGSHQNPAEAAREPLLGQEGGGSALELTAVRYNGTRGEAGVP